MITRIKNFFPFFIFLIILLSFFCNTNKVLAATINFSPISGTSNVGDIIKINILISTDKSINAVSENISFSPELLNVTSISKNSSIVSLWTQEPSFSNITGNINFEGVILNGYIGNAGNIITVFFKAKNEGIASLKFSNVSILANDGNGTDIFSRRLFPGTIHIEKNIKTLDKENKTLISNCENKNFEEQKLAIQCVAINAAEKIEEVEISNNLPQKSLLVTIIIAFIILLLFIILYLFAIIIRIKKYFKNKFLNTENIISKNFKNLEKDIALKNVKITKEEDNILKDVVTVEEKIIKEVGKIEDKL